MPHFRFSLRFLMGIVTALCLALFLVKSVVDFFSVPSPSRHYAMVIITHYAAIAIFVTVVTLTSDRSFFIPIFTSLGALIGFWFTPRSFTLGGRRMPTFLEEFIVEFLFFGLPPLLGAIVGFLIIIRILNALEPNSSKSVDGNTKLQDESKSDDPRYH